MDTMKSCVFTGHRPGKFPFTSEQNPLCIRIKASIVAAIRQLYVEKGVRYVFVGGALGGDMWVSEAVLLLRKEYPALELVIVPPFDGHTDRWPDAEKTRFEKILAQSMVVPPPFNAYHPQAYRARNEWLVGHANFLIALFDGVFLARSGTGQTVRMAQGKGIPILLINPGTGEYNELDG